MHTPKTIRVRWVLHLRMFVWYRPLFMSCVCGFRPLCESDCAEAPQLPQKVVSVGLDSPHFVHIFSVINVVPQDPQKAELSGLKSWQIGHFI